MSKEYLEALEHIYYGSQGYGETDKYYEYLKEYLESIDNANPSEALKELEKSLNKAFDYGVQYTLDNLLLRGYDTKTMLEKQCFGKTLIQDLDEDKIKTTSVKSDIIKQALLKAQEMETMANEYDLQPSQIREALLVFSMMQGAGYKLSDIEKAQEQEKVLEILKEKKVELMSLYLSSSVEEYNNQFVRDENKLTQNEFDLLKRYFG